VEILESTRQAIANEAGGDPLLEFAIRRYIYVRLKLRRARKAVERRKLKEKLFDPYASYWHDPAGETPHN
jgi:hypothetical protein